MTQITDLNVSPYYDDFDKNDNFHNQITFTKKPSLNETNILTLDLLNDNYKSAKLIYKKYQFQNVTDTLSWVKKTKQDFENFKKVGIQNDNFENYYENYNRKAFKQSTVGAKYLIYDPNKNYEEKIDVLSWKNNHKFKFRSLLPAVGIYAGMNLNLTNNEFSFPSDPKISPKAMLITQNQLGRSVFVTNIIADKSLSVMNVNKDKKSKLTKRTLNAVTKTVTIKRDLSGVYVDVKAKMNDDSVCAKHNVSVNTLAAVKAWITMGK